MRLSATDRIIREAEQHGDAAVEAADHPDTEKVSAAPFVALGIPAPRMPAPLDGGVDIDLDGDDGGQDEEGETQVDAQRSAAALKEMRALQGTRHTSAPAGTRDPKTLRSRGLPPGRPAGTAPPSVPTLAGPGPSPATTLTFGAPPPLPHASVVRPPARALADTDDHRPDQLFSSSQIQFGVVVQPSDAQVSSGSWPPPRRVGRVSRRTGMAIAASTALAVALVAGAWTAKKSPLPTESTIIPAPPPVLPSSLRPGANAPTAPRPNGPVVVATPPSPTPVAPEPAPAETPPAAEDVAPPPEAAAEAAPVPVTAPAAPLPKRAQAAGAAPTKKAAAKARIAKKRAALAAAAAKRRARAHKGSRAVASASSEAKSISATASPSRSTASRGSGADPDDTLPITD